MTGYTSIFEEKPVTFAEFLWRCSRAFEAFMHMRDNRLDAPLRRDGRERTRTASSTAYHAEQLADASKNMRELEQLTVKQAGAMAKAQYNTLKQEWDNSLLKKRALRKRLETVLAEAKAWEPPTKDHTGLKAYMIEQLESTIAFDCNLDEDRKPKLLSGGEYITLNLKHAQADIDYHTEKLQESQKVDTRRDSWIDELQASVPYPGGRL